MKTTFYYILAAIFAFAAVSCQTTDGPEQDVVVADIFFSTADNGDYCWYVGEGQTGEATLSIFRANSTAADEYEIKVLSKSEGLEIPSSVSFAAGQTTASITIKTPSTASLGDILSFELQFVGDNVNSSANSSEGTVRCEGTFYFYKEMIGALQFFDYSGKNDNGVYDFLGNIRQVVWKLDDQNWLFKDFLKGGYDLKVIVNQYSGLITAFSYGYDTHNVVDDSGTQYYFYNDGIEEFAEYEYYQPFFPKGEQRYIYALSLYADPTQFYSYHAAASDSYPEYFSICCPLLSFYGEEEGLDKEYTDWSRIFITFFDEATLASMDFESFPEVDIVEFPEAVYSEEMKDGKYPVQIYFNNEGVYADTQYASIEGESFVIDDFMQSGLRAMITPSGSTFSVDFTDAGGNKVSATAPDTSGYLNLTGSNLLYPWQNGIADYWCITSFYFYADASYTGWDSEKKEAYFYGYYNIWNPFAGEEGEYISGQGNVYIYW